MNTLKLQNSTMWREKLRSSLYCHTCNELKTDKEHNLSEKHLKNVALLKFSQWRGKHFKKDNGILISCSAKSANATLMNSDESRIKLSVRPDEVVQFDFTLMNNTDREDLFICFAKVLHTRLNFTMNDHGLGVGCIPKCVRPYQKLEKDINVTFSSPDIGQYECPLLFSLKKMLANEDIYVVKEIIVVVEEKQMQLEEVMESNFVSKPINGDTLYKTTHKSNKISSEFKVPQEKRKIFAKNLTMGSKSTTEEKKLAKDIESIFDTGATPDNYKSLFHNLLWYEETIEKIQLQKYNMCNVRLESVCDNYLLVVPGLAEKRPSLMLGDLVLVKPSNTNAVIFEGAISEVMEEAIYIRGFHPEFANYSDGHFDIRFLSCRMSFERMHRGLSKSQDEGMLTRAFPNADSKASDSVIKPIKQFFNPDIKDNAEQRSAVEHILAKSSGTAPYLIHGPPGTGKTVTVVETILQIIRQRPNERVLVCTDSNTAADHVAVQILKYAFYFKKNEFLLRANAKYRVWETMPAELAPYSNGTSRFDWTPVTIKKFSSYQIVVTTLAHSAKYANARRKKRQERNISHLFIDEAAQALEPMVLLPTCGLLKPLGTLVLAGDPLQLGPVVISPVAKQAGLGTSLMERLKNTCELYSDDRNDPNYMVMLRNNFRSHPDIIELPSKLFYKEQLRACAKLDPLSTLNILTGLNNCRAIVFHGVLSAERRVGKSPSFFNPLEQVLVHRYVVALVEKYEVPFEDIGVVTPYIRQTQMIRHWLNTKGYYGIEVGTVEAFQGKEKRFVIISTVRANADLLSHDAKFQLGFLADGKRFNVAITRAKAKVIVIGNPLCLTNDDKWRAYIEKCRQIGTYYGFDFEGTDNTNVYEELSSNISRLLIKHSS